MLHPTANALRVPPARLLDNLSASDMAAGPVTAPTTAPTTVPTAAPAAPPVAPSAPAMAGDTLETRRPFAARPSLREQVQIAETLSGKPMRFKTDAELEAYLSSMTKGIPPGAYDRDGFLASLGLTDPRASGRIDKPTLDAVRKIPHYKPESLVNGKPSKAQHVAFKLAVNHPKIFLGLTHVTNPIIEAKAKLEHEWSDPLTPPEQAVPTGLTPQERYAEAYAQYFRFENDFHGGVPGMVGVEDPRYGTWAIARSLGFADATARRLGENSVGIDENSTPYGKTAPGVFERLDRHFNLDRDGQDTRLVYAQKHLQNAIAFAQISAYDQAELELGCGLHSLQDIFAHGQLSPSMHATLGQFPDQVDWNPVGFYEATEATAAYLRAYLRAIAHQ